VKRRYLALIIACLLSLLGCAQPPPSPPPAAPMPSLPPTAPPSEPPLLEETKQIIEVEVVDQVVQYQCQCFWSEEKFSQLSENDLKARFKGKYSVDARDFEFSFDKTNYSTITKCRVCGAISKSRVRYTADFLWLLNPLGLDFIEDHFKESNHGLSWEGKINGVLTTMEVECPPKDSIYKAWQDPVGHCHGHIWWPVSS